MSALLAAVNAEDLLFLSLLLLLVSVLDSTESTWPI
jgi:hypothetical protein